MTAAMLVALFPTDWAFNSPNFTDRSTVERVGRDRDDVDRNNVDADIDDELAAVVLADGTADCRPVNSEAAAACHRSANNSSRILEHAA